jgi:hypothetical protein
MSLVEWCAGHIAGPRVCSFPSISSHLWTQLLCLCLLCHEIKWQNRKTALQSLQKTGSYRSFSRLPHYSKDRRSGGGGGLASSACLRQTDGREVFPWRLVEMPDIAVLELSAMFSSLHLFIAPFFIVSILFGCGTWSVIEK